MLPRRSRDITNRGDVLPWRTRRRVFVAVAATVVAGVTAGVAQAYWDHSGSCSQGSWCGLEFTVGYGNYATRLSRQYCGTKLENRDYGGSWHIYSIPGGCATSDTGEVPFSSDDYGLSGCYNVDGPTMWVNCAILDT